MTEYICDELSMSIPHEYARQIADKIVDDVIEDIAASAGEEPNESDIRLAVGRVLCKKIGVEI